ncbi:MAG: hypothetical protein KIS73_05145 [Enhydrobacter sp.]|nr:hypothetical protein [Enhydrobacter sp.]
MASSLASNAANMIARKGKTIVWTRASRTTSATPWAAGPAVLDSYTFKGRITGVAAQYMTDATILASDLMVTAGTKATDADGAIVDLAPRMGDTLRIDGVDRAIKRIVPAADDNGAVAVVRMFVAS